MCKLVVKVKTLKKFIRNHFTKSIFNLDKKSGSNAKTFQELYAKLFNRDPVLVEKTDIGHTVDFVELVDAAIDEGADGIFINLSDKVIDIHKFREQFIKKDKSLCLEGT